MESTLQALGGILLKAIPTLVLLLILLVYLRWMFFRPLEKVLAQRKAATDGARQSAEALLAKADQTAAAIEAELRKAREAIYQEQEEARRRLLTEQSERLDAARHSTRELVQQARQQLDQDVAAAKKQLALQADGLADQIVQSLLERKIA
jgi:F-type H+-transporting ATPase subunit b